MTTRYIGALGQLVGCLYVLQTIVNSLQDAGVPIDSSQPYQLEEYALSYSLGVEEGPLIVAWVDIEQQTVNVECYALNDGEEKPELDWIYHHHRGWTNVTKGEHILPVKGYVLRLAEEVYLFHQTYVAWRECDA